MVLINVKSVFKPEIVQKQVTTNLGSVVLCSGWKWYEVVCYRTACKCIQDVYVDLTVKLLKILFF